ncbi:hypothetical protein EVAR_14854_1 [Eumeta japonica]|uniref:Uncharacterized protein n=1 Tax=Eumeta variegata TaxID=151549 RepID=A0A4C1V2X7_EUMVA|nr:hypothetical protein EVAR_14854_1 [Eumeta japonica]
MSILHTLAPVRVGIDRDESDDKSDDFDSFTEAADGIRVPTARDMRCGRRLEESSRHRMSQETVTGRFPLLPGRRWLAAAGWSKELFLFPARRGGKNVYPAHPRARTRGSVGLKPIKNSS